MGFERHEVIDSLGRRISYYISHPAKPAPLLLIVQGSGCDALFPVERRPDGVYNAYPPFVRSVAGDRFTILVVEKPFAQPQQAKPRIGEACSAAFNRDFSADRWLVGLTAALGDAKHSPWVSPGPTFALGHSEGAPMAAMVAAHDPDITGLAYFAGPGETQAYDTMLAAYGRGATTTERLDNLEKAEAQIKWIMAHPDSTTDFAWGHTYLRWSSFYRLSSLDLFRRTKARIYIASGTSDENVPFWSTQIAVAGLLADGRAFESRMIPDADHSFRTPGARGSDQTAAEYAKALDWLLKPTISSP